MSSPPTNQPSDFAGGAVFLSYAREDTVAVLRMAEALRAVGAEVWLDQSELTGGDAWDRKIRAQIGSCALFVPVVSAATQARREGYFRLEWKLADERTHLMAEGTPFILPVVIDDTTEREALVPKSFLAVQWTRLRPAGLPAFGGARGDQGYGGQALHEPSLEAFGARVKKLLGGSAIEAGRPRAAQRDEGVASPAVNQIGTRKVGRRVPAAAWGVAVAVLAGAGVFLWKQSKPSLASMPNAGAGTRPPTAEKSSSTTSTLAPSTSALAAGKSVAVLPFENLSGDKDNEYFSDGISVELLNQLGKVPGLRVAGRTSAFSFKGKNVPDAEIARTLGVAYVVNGTVQKAGTQVRITARLNNAADGFQIWSEKFTEELKDIFAVQDKIAGLIAQNLQLTLGAARPARRVNPEAHQLVLEGRHFWMLRTDVAFERAEAAYQHAIELDPDFAEAHAGLADVWAIRGWYRIMAGNAVCRDAAPTRSYASARAIPRGTRWRPSGAETRR